MFKNTEILSITLWLLFQVFRFILAYFNIIVKYSRISMHVLDLYCSTLFTSVKSGCDCLQEVASKYL